MKPTVSLFNIISVVVFAIMALLCLWAAQYNAIHYLFAIGSTAFVVIGLYDNMDGKSIVDWFKERKANRVN